MLQKIRVAGLCLVLAVFVGLGLWAVSAALKFTVAEFAAAQASQIELVALTATKLPDVPTCETEAQTRLRVAGLAKHVTFEVLDAALYLPLFDQLPPATHTPPLGRLIAARSPEKSQVMLLGFVGGCLIISGHLDSRIHAKILKSLGRGI